MQIVKIFPNNKEKQHFSIRKYNNKYFVFEGDKSLRTELDNINTAETEISLIVLLRRKNKIKEVPVSYEKTAVVSNDSKEKEVPQKSKCKQCDVDFDGRKSRGNPKQYCSDKCRTKYNNSKDSSLIDLSERNCKFCNNVFKPKRNHVLNCSVKCSQKSYALQKKLDKKLLEKLDLQPKIDITDSKDLYEKTKILDEVNKRDSFELGIAKSVDGIFFSPSVVNEFHDLTEKQMKLDQRLSRVKYLAYDIVEYIVLWCENNKNFDHFQDYNRMFENLVKMKIVDLTKIELMNVMPELIEYTPQGFCKVKSYNFQDQFPFIMFKERLAEYIISEGAIPSEEQYQKSSILRLLTSQMYFVKKQFLESKAPIKEEEIIDPLNREEPIIRDYMLEESMPQNTINDVTEALNNLSDRIDTIGNTQKYYQELNAKRDSSIQTQLKQISDRVSEITKKRKGIFG